MHFLLSQCLPAVSWCFSTQSTSTKLRAQCESSINMWCSHSKRRKVRHLQATRNLMRTVAKAKAAAMSLQCCAVFQLVQSICWWAISSPNSPSFASLSPLICISVFVSDVSESIQYISIYVLILATYQFCCNSSRYPHKASLDSVSFHSKCSFPWNQVIGRESFNFHWSSQAISKSQLQAPSQSKSPCPSSLLSLWDPNLTCFLGCFGRSLHYHSLSA